MIVDKTISSFLAVLLALAGLAEGAEMPGASDGRGKSLSTRETRMATEKEHRAEWMHRGSFGLMVHYLISPSGKTADEKQAALDKAVESFDADLFVKQFEETGADWLIFTLGQNTGYYCSSNAWLDAELPGRTSKRDLALDIARRVKADGKRFIAYLPAEVARQSDEARRVFSWNPADQAAFQKRYQEFVRAYAVKFGKDLDGWWFDGCYERPSFPKFDWPAWLAAARAGNPAAIVAFNVGALTGPAKPRTSLEDYCAGETFQLPPPCMPPSQLVDGVQWHALMPLDGTFTGGEPHSYEDPVLFDWAVKVKAAGGAFTLNVPLTAGGTMQWFPKEVPPNEGRMRPATIAQLKRLSERLRAPTATGQ